MKLCTQNRLCQLKASECCIKEDFKQNLFIEYKAVSKDFAVIIPQLIDIYHTKKQPENIPSS